MKNFFTLCVMALMAVCVNAQERVTVWEGEQEMGSSWPSVAIKLADIKEKVSFKSGDAFIVTISKADNKINTGWTYGPQVFIKLDWADPAIFSAKSVDDGATNIEVKYAIGDEEMALLSAGTELEIQGMNVVVTKLEVEVNEVIEYETTGTPLEFNEYGQIFKSQLADYSDNDKVVFTYKIEGSTDYEEGGETKSVLGWGIGTIGSLGGNVKLADLAVKGIGEYSVSFTMKELADALDDTNTTYNTNGVGVSLWSCNNAVGSLVSIVAYKAVAAKTYSVIGTINGNWDTDADMTKGDDGKYSVTIKNVAPGDYEFKVRVDHAWNEDYGDNGGNVKITVKTAGDVTITFDPETKEITYTGADPYTVPEDATYSVIGTINGNWNTDTDMTKGDDGIYTATFENVKAGEYKLKVRVNHDWTTNYGGGDDSDGNSVFTVTQDGSKVVVTFNPETKAVTVTVTPATGITAVKAAQQDGVRYNLAGQKVNAGYKGVVIENGKKFVVK